MARLERESHQLEDNWRSCGSATYLIPIQKLKEYPGKKLQIFLEALKTAPGVVALGGGSVLDPIVNEYLQASSIPVLYLEVSISQAAPRVGFNKERPLLAMNPRQQWMQLMEKRRPIYEGLATRSFNTDNRKPAEVAREIADVIGAASEEH